MFRTIVSLLLVTATHSRFVKTWNSTTMFKNEQIIFASDFNITKLLVPADGQKFIRGESSDIPSIFFVIADPKLDGGTCIYVLEGFAAYEIMEGGRDVTADYGSDKTVFFGGKDGVYKYCFDSLSAKKYGPFHDDIIQLQKTNGSDTIIFLNSEKKMFKLEKNGTVRTRIHNIPCALEFVLDTSNNIYFIACNDRMPHIVRADGTPVQVITSKIENLERIMLVRPAFIMESCVPFFGDSHWYILYSNGTFEKKDFHLDENPSAFSFDAALYLVVALDGKIFEFNVMDVLIRSMFGLTAELPRDVTKIVMSIIDTAKESIYGYYKGWNSSPNMI